MLKKLFNLQFNDLPTDNFIKNVISDNYNQKVIVTPNVDHVVRFNRDAKFNQQYSQADIFINDSRIIKLFSKLTKKPLSFVSPGSDMTRTIFSRYSEIVDNEICVLGATNNDVSEICQRFCIAHLNHYIPPYGFINNEEEILKCIEYCKTLPKCLYFVAVGSPQQEILAVRLKNAGVNGTFLCVGASLLFLSGSEKRAPKVIQYLNLEWLFRLIQSPTRLWRRYLVDGPYIFKLVLEEIKNDIFNKDPNR
jgi:N-acetylglucosaminyldiphosphoundecaprenol N-acetyl-beta-D-mannosaminyltransferase